MAAPDLRQRYGSRVHGRDVLMGHASHGRHSVPSPAEVVAKVIDWFESAAGAAWYAAQSAAGWFTENGGGWFTSESSEDWYSTPSGSDWFEDC